MSKRPHCWKSAVLALLCLGSMHWVEAGRWSSAAGRAPAALSVDSAGEATWLVEPKVLLVERSRGRIPSPPGAPSAHASSIAVLPGGDLLAYWWAGARESAPDVQVYMSRYAAGQWSAPVAVVERKALGAEIGFGIRRLGNPVPWVAPDGRVHLYVVATGLGGWAASRVVHLTSSDEGREFSAVRVLPLSPLFNTSVLVRNNAVATADGGWLLPAYFELGHKFGMVVSFDRDGVPRWLSRIGGSTSSLQPAIVPMNERKLVAMLRSHDPLERLQVATSRDGGRTWTDEPESVLPNHGTAAAALRLTGGAFVLAHNETPVAGGTSRQRLRLSTSLDAREWSPAREVRIGVPSEEFSYPTLQQVGQQLHLTYTDRRLAIAHDVYDIHFVGPLP
jgi:predicted neuraminidase